MGFALSDISITSSAFSAGGAIPARHTGEGEDVSPALSFANIPDGTQSLAVFCHDPDAPLISPRGTYGFAHWVLYNLPATVIELPEGCSDYTAGKNDFGNPGYGGPMPPPGHGAHRYYFWVVALDSELNLPEGLDLWDFLAKVEPHVLGINRLVGSYQRN